MTATGLPVETTFVELARLPIKEGRTIVIHSSELPLRAACLQLELQRPPAPSLKITIPGSQIGALLTAIAAFQKRAEEVKRLHATYAEVRRPGIPRGRAQ
jgi:hypothetical protein